MLLNTTKIGTVELELSLGEAFKLQDALTQLVRQLTCNVHGEPRPSRSGTGKMVVVVGCDLGMDTYVTQHGLPDNAPSGVTLVVTKPHIKA